MSAAQDCGIALPHPTHQYRDRDRVFVCPGVSTGKDPERDEHVILVGFEVAGESRHAAMDRLSEQLPVPHHSTSIEGWWIAEDDRVDGTDNNSAVFVPKGEQQATTDRLAHREPHARYVVLVGNPGAALTLYGPFEEHEDAVWFADDTFKDQSWSVDALMGTLA